MKKILTLFWIAFGVLMAYQEANAQTQAENQNPNFRVSMNKYLAAADSLSVTMNTTVQNTYKAYDWYEAREERRALRKQYRHEERMARIKYGRDYYPNYYGSYYGYNSGWNWNWMPRVGYRTGNWWFSIKY
jgi:hypothetical protein